MKCSLFIFQNNTRGLAMVEILLIASAVLIVSLGGYGGYRYNLLSHELQNAENRLNENSNALNQVTVDFEKQASNLKENLSTLEQANEALQGKLTDEQNRNNSFENQIRGISSSVTALEKINSIDRELLQKYSKVYFLNEHYTPSSLVGIDPRYASGAEKALRIHTRVWPYLQRMMDDAASSSLKLTVVSAYRSFGEQSSLKSSYKILYGSGANKFSADQGYSEHQLGTTVDLSTPSLQDALSVRFESTPEYKWLSENAYRYGFILSYPRQNAYYQFEPWHWRFVGVALATKIKEQKTYFYNMDQREIDSYRINIFD